MRVRIRVRVGVRVVVREYGIHLVQGGEIVTK